MSILSVDTIQPIGSGSTVTLNAAKIVVGTGITFESNGQAIYAGIITATSFSGSGANLTSLPAQATIANNADNRVITGGSGVNLNGESTLTYNGSTLIFADTTGDAYIQYGAHSTIANNFVLGAQGDGTFRLFNGTYASGTERLRIDSAGAAFFKGVSSGSQGTINLESTDPFIRLYDTDGTADKRKWDIRNIGAGGFEELDFRTVNDANDSFVSRMQIENTGDVNISDGNLRVASGHGIDFSVTGNGSGSMSNELLDDYEEGSWTPYIRTTNNTTQPSYNQQLGLYTKVGRLVTWMARITTSGELSTGSGATEMWGFPYAAMTWGGNGDWPGGGEIAYYYNLRGAYGTNPRILGPYNNSTFIRFHTFSNQTDISTNGYNIFFTNNTLMIMTGQYYTA